MSVNFSNLEAMDAKDLHVLAREQGLTLHHALGKDKVIKAIIEYATTPVATPTIDHPLIKPAAPVHHNTEEDVEAKLVQLKANNPNFKTIYRPDNTWHFQWLDNAGRVRREESGNLAIPLRIILQKAANIAQGPLQLKALTNPNQPGYTNSVLI